MVIYRNIRNTIFEIEVGKTDNSFNLHFSISTKCDHPGLNFYISIFNRFIEFSIYDRRHWDNNKNTFVEYNEKNN